MRRPEDTVFSDEVWRALAGSLGWSHRESQIVPELFDDRKETAIAARLGISRHTVHTHIERLYRKMGITSRVELARRVFLEYMRVATSQNAESNLRKSRLP
jgi:DNA-binding NarL/FixJ family response regulator